MIDSTHDPADLEETACPLCMSAAKSEAYRFPPYVVALCRECEFSYLSPRPSEPAMMKIYRQAEYFAGSEVGYDDYDEQTNALRLTFRTFLEEMRKHRLTGGALLEVGCGYGYFLDEARGFFQRRCGTEYSGKAVEESRRRADTVYHGGIDRVPTEENFDCIVGIQVIEHVHRPVDFLERAVRVLRDDGLLILVTPDMGSLWRRVLGRRWPSFKIPEHILYFNKTTLALLMRKAGLDGIGSLPYPHAFPLTLVFRKLGIDLPRSFQAKNMWIPQTSIVMYGRLVIGRQ